MAQLKAGSTVGGAALLLILKPSNLIGGAGSANQFLGVNANNEITFLSAFQSQAQGSVEAFNTSGLLSSGSPLWTATVDKFPFNSPFTTATSVGSLSPAIGYGAGQSSSTEGFTSGGANSTGFYVTTISKFAFTSPTFSATSVGNLSQIRAYAGGHYSSTEGFTSGGTTNAPNTTNTIDKFPFSAPFTTATSVGVLNENKSSAASQSSATEAFNSTGVGPTIALTGISKFPFSAPFTTATSAGSLGFSPGLIGAAGVQSSLKGYICIGRNPPGGLVPPGYNLPRLSFPFSAPFASVSFLGNMVQEKSFSTGHSSTTNGYVSGGSIGSFTPPFTALTQVESFPFSSDPTTSVSIGNLTQARYSTSGQQY